MNDFSRLPRKRYAVRSYLPKPVEAEKLERILEAGRAAPTAKNNQPFRFLVVQRTEGLKNFQMHQCARLSLGDHRLRRPFLKRGCGPDGKGMVDTDTAIAATHMLSEGGRSAGLGSCWMTRFDPAVVRELFRIPEGTEPEHILAIGYPAENAHPSERHTKRKPLRILLLKSLLEKTGGEAPFWRKGPPPQRLLGQ